MPMSQPQQQAAPPSRRPAQPAGGPSPSQTLPLIGAVVGIVGAVLGIASFLFSLGDVGRAVEMLSISLAATDVVLAIALFAVWRAFFRKK